MNEEKRMTIVCDCHTREHQFTLSYWTDDEDLDCLFLHAHLSTSQGFLRRLWAGLRFAFGYRCRYGEWDEVVASAEVACEMRDFIDAFLDDRRGV